MQPAYKETAQPPEATESHTPMMTQYHAVKAAHPDCLLFYRMGDFYELFFKDAEIAASVLGITLTRRGKAEGTDIPMCGVPFHSYEPYLAKLIKAGHKVAICEQTETPEQAKARAKAAGQSASKALVQRSVTRIVTQGTLTEDHLLDARTSNHLACVAKAEGRIGLAWLDISTGSFYVTAPETSDLAAALDAAAPREILIAEGLQQTLHALQHYEGAAITRWPSSLFDSGNAIARLQNIFGVGTLDGMGGFTAAEITAAGALLEYTERTQVGKLPFLAPPQHIQSRVVVGIDPATRRNLELTQTQTGERKGSLLHAIDRTQTAAGARLLGEWLSAPLTDPALINKRLDRIACLKDAPALLTDIGQHLKSIPDIERALGRVTAGRGGPRDLCGLRDGLSSMVMARAILQQQEASRIVFADILADLQIEPTLQTLQDKLKAALINDPPALARDGGFVAPGYHTRLDELKLLQHDSRRLIAGLQQKYQQISKVDALKIKHNNILGFFIEVTARQADGLMRGAEGPFIHRQTLANAARFTTTELAELERDISSAQEKSLALELEIFEDLCAACASLSSTFKRIARALAALDVAAGLATLAADENYARPMIDGSAAFSIQGGRHPVVEQALRPNGKAFVPNDCTLPDGAQLWLLTGPNMAGKSTFLRQNALIAIMAQAGSFVPAEAAHIGVVDRIFSRVGAADDLARGRSTFMVEMVETAAILNQATPRSLVILDEIGRGTATFDGLSIAWACVEHLHNVNKSRGLFATHYHELTALTDTLKGLSSHSLEVKEWKGDIIFLHHVVPGAASGSYGIHVGKLAGLPAPVIARARQVLETLQQAGHTGKLQDNLPLFSFTAETTPPQPPASSALEDFITAINPDTLSPKEALELLYELKMLQQKNR